MSVFNDDEPTRRYVNNNICAFHIGNGYILSVAHNLRTTGIPSSMPVAEFQSLLGGLDVTQQALFNGSYSLDPQTNKRYINPGVDQVTTAQIAEALNKSPYDNRWLTFYTRNICRPFLMIELRSNQFYGDASATQQINPVHIYFEPQTARHTFLLELQLVEAFYENDFALYRIVNRSAQILSRLPLLEIDFNFYTSSNKDFFCLQSSPLSNLGRLLNDAEIEGILDVWSVSPDRFGGNYLMDGSRYLINGYFRFGSSGAPYLKYDARSGKLKVNAIQSQASPIQLAINNRQDGNFQYVKGIASPLKNIETRLKQLITQ
jgi:hypothetical protein